MQDPLSTTDLALLRELQDDARLTSAELGTRLSISQSPAWRRLKRLEQVGVIEGYRAVLNRKQLGLSVLAMVQISIDRHDASARAFEQAVSEIPQVVFCHGMSGPEDFLLLVVARDFGGLLQHTSWQAAQLAKREIYPHQLFTQSHQRRHRDTHQRVRRIARGSFSASAKPPAKRSSQIAREVSPSSSFRLHPVECFQRIAHHLVPATLRFFRRKT